VGLKQSQNMDFLNLHHGKKVTSAGLVVGIFYNGRMAAVWSNPLIRFDLPGGPCSGG
jgi:hypothetical protein